MDDVNLVLNNLPEPWPLRIVQPSVVAYSRVHVTEPINYEEQTKILTAWKNLILNANRVILIVHGFESSIKTRWVQEMKDALLRRADVVVVLVDWAGGAKLRFFQYMQAVSNTQTVSAWLAGTLSIIRNIRPSLYVWGIGHSLGAHLIGQTGQHNQLINRITGLDPAGPAFELANCPIRLNPHSATDLVDVIHTDGFNFERFGRENLRIPVNHFGSLAQLGTYDFYPNYGTSNQPGACSISSSHHRAVELFIWSIDNPGRFTTRSILAGEEKFDRPVTSVRQVDMEVEMGYYADQNPPNPDNYPFYLPTNAAPPYAPLVGSPPPAFRNRSVLHKRCE